MSAIDNPHIHCTCSKGCDSDETVLTESGQYLCIDCACEEGVCPECGQRANKQAVRTHIDDYSQCPACMLDEGTRC